MKKMMYLLFVLSLVPAVVVSADDFIQDHNDGESQLYTVYLMGDSAELILATDPADVETK